MIEARSLIICTVFGFMWAAFSKITHLVVVGVSCSKPVVRTENQLLHDALNTWVHIAGHVTCWQVPCDKLVGNWHNVAKVRSQAESKHCKLVALQRVLLVKPNISVPLTMILVFSKLSCISATMTYDKLSTSKNMDKVLVLVQRESSWEYTYL